METMISVDRALQLIKENITPLLPVKRKLVDASSMVLAKDVIAPISIPSFPQSSMDGYAFAHEEGLSDYEIIGEIAAGDKSNLIIEKGKAVRIFTGAPVPQGADTVVMQEKVSVIGNRLKILDDSLSVGTNVRAIGAEIQKGERALPAGFTLNPIAIGLLAGLGIAEVEVFPKPIVGILVTGNELQQSGNVLQYGQVYDSNSYSLRAALKQTGIEEIRLLQSTDRIDELSIKLTQLIDETDLILVVGGVSVGDYDFTLKAFEQCSVQPIFHKIKQKPGKPLLIGHKDKKIVFGLPGNPASVMTCFYEYVLPCIGNMISSDLSMKKMEALLGKGFTKPSGLTSFLRAQYDGQIVTVLQGQESFKLSSFAQSNCLVRIPEGIAEIKAGEHVEIHLLP